MGQFPPLRRRRRWLLWIGVLLLGFYVVPVGYKLAEHYYSENRDLSWSERRHDSSKQAPSSKEYADAIIQVYAARAMRWRGALGVHTWIATRKSDEETYTRMEVMGYALRWGGRAVQFRHGGADRYWYGSSPVLLRDLRGGEEVDRIIDNLREAASSYPYNDHYRVWPGPNSNTFIAHLAREVPQLGLDLPPTAIGKDYLPNGGVIDQSPSGKGLQLSLRGLLGLIVSAEEGLEMNVLGLTAGVDFSPFALKVPGIGRIGFPDYRKIIMNESADTDSSSVQVGDRLNPESHGDNSPKLGT